jgi:hypothetical protein
MVVNANKTKNIIFHTRGKRVDTGGIGLVINNNVQGDNNPSLVNKLERIHNNNNPNKTSRLYKLLGFLPDINLSLNNHISTLCNKLSKALYCLRRTKNILPKKALKTLHYYSLFHCNLTYCPNILSITSQSNNSKISALQRKAIRIITDSSNRAHTAELFTELKILPFEKPFSYSQLIFMHSVEYGYNSALFHSLPEEN